MLARVEGWKDWLGQWLKCRGSVALVGWLASPTCLQMPVLCFVVGS